MPSVRQSDAMNALRFLRTIHGWIGVVVIPWVLLYGLTGFYLNHERDMAFLFGSDEVDLLWREDQPGRLSDEAAARAWFAQVFPDLPVEKVTDEDYHGKPAFQIATGSLLVIAPKNSSFYFDKTSHVRQLHDNTGAVINHHVYWPSILKELHTHGWLRSPLGTTLADLFSLLLIGFGLTGACLWTIPRLMRSRARRTAGRMSRG
jgi:hypothetical protein